MNDPRGNVEPSQPAPAAYDDLLGEMLERIDEVTAAGGTPRLAADTDLPDALSDELVGLGQCLAILNTAARRGGVTPLTLLSADVAAPGAEFIPDIAAGNSADQGLEGERIGRFEIVRELGRGGYGVVFLARDPALSRDVALKLPRPEALVSDDLRRRFLREAAAAGRLAHPHLLPVFEAGEDGALCYLVTPYCRGPSLANWLAGQSQAINPREAAQLVAGLADALDYAHGRGVLHRDIKPANVLLDLSSTEGMLSDVELAARPLSSFVPKLGDFGLAKLLEATDEETRTGTVLGTPGYMAPEQTSVGTTPIGEAADIYSLGAILYEMLTGSAPFGDASAASTLARVATEEPRPPRAIRPQLPRDLEAICLKCLEKSPTDRYATAGKLADDLRRFLAGQSTIARPNGRARQAWRWMRRRPAISGLVLVAAALTVVMVVGRKEYSEQLAFEQSSALARQYARDMRFAFQARQQGSAAQADAILARYEAGSPSADLRGFEWYWLRGALDSQSHVVPTRHGEAYKVLFSPDGRWVVTGGEDGMIRAWDPSSGKLGFELPGHTSCVNNLAFAPDGRTLASGSCDKTARLWDFAARRELRTIGGQTGIVGALAFAHSGKWLAIGTRNAATQVWNVADGTLLATLPSIGYDGIAVCRDDAFLAQTSGTIFRSDDWGVERQLPFETRTLGFVGREQSLMVTTSSRELLQCETSSDQPPVRLAHLPVDTCDMAPLVAHEGLVVSGFGGLIRVFGVNRPLARWFTIDAERVESVAVAPGDRRLAAVTFDGNLHLWDLAPKPLLRANVSAASQAAVLSADAGPVITFDSDGAIVCWDPVSAEPQVVRAGFGNIRLLSQSGRLLLATSSIADGSQTQLLSVPDLEQVPHVNAWPTISAASISADDQVVAIADTNGNLTVTEVATGRVRFTQQVAAEDLGVVGLSLNNDGSCLVRRAHKGSELHAFDTQTGQRIKLPADLSFLGSVAAWPSLGYSPDGRRHAVTLTNDFGVAIQETISGKVLVHLRQTSGLTYNLAWTPDATRLAVATAQNSIALFDTRTGEELGELDGGLAPLISNLYFSADGQNLRAVTGGEMEQPGSLCDWQASPKDDPH